MPRSVLVVLLINTVCATSAIHEVTFPLMEEFNTKHCLLVSEFIRSQASALRQVKKFSDSFVPVGLTDFEGMREAIVDRYPFYARTMVVMDVKDQKDLQRFMENSDIFNIQKKSTYLWVLLLSGNVTLNPEDVHIRFSIEFLAVSPINETAFGIDEVYKIRTTHKKMRYGVWTREGKLVARKEPFLQRRADFEGDEFLVLDLDEDAIHVLLKTCQDVFKFRIKYYEIYQFKKSFDGSVLADVFLGKVPFHATNSKRTLVGPIQQLGFHLYMNLPEDGGLPFYSSLLRPFSPKLWYVLLIWAAIFTISSMVVNYILWRMSSENRNVPFDMSGYGFLTLDCLSNQEGRETFTALSSRISIFMTRIVGTLAIMTFSGKLTSLYVCQDEAIPFTDFEGFVKDGRYNITGVTGMFSQQYIEETKGPLMDHVRKYHYVNDILTVPEIIDRVCKEKLVLLEDEGMGCNSDALKRERKSKKCFLIHGRKPVMKVNSALWLQNDSEFKEAFQFVLLIWYSSGLKRLEVGKCHDDFTVEERSDEKFPKVICLSIGMGFSLLFFVLEQLYFRMCTKTDLWSREGYR